MIPFWCGMLDRLANSDHQLQPLANGEMLCVAVVGDGDAFYEVHHEVGAAGGVRSGECGRGSLWCPRRLIFIPHSPFHTPHFSGGSRVQHPRNVWVVHHRQGLAFGFKAGDHLPCVHAGLDDFQGDSTLDGVGLLGHEDDTHAPFADLLQQFVRADDGAGLL